MDQRTRKKYLQAARVMLHLLEGHLSRLPKGKTLQNALAEGIAAAQALGFDAVGKEERARGAAECASRTAAVLQRVKKASETAQAARNAHTWPFHIPAMGRGIEALYSGPLVPSCGIERSLPRGDQ